MYYLSIDHRCSRDKQKYSSQHKHSGLLTDICKEIKKDKFYHNGFVGFVVYCYGFFSLFLFFFKKKAFWPKCNDCKICQRCLAEPWLGEKLLGEAWWLWKSHDVFRRGVIRRDIIKRSVMTGKKSHDVFRRVVIRREVIIRRSVMNVKKVKLCLGELSLARSNYQSEAWWMWKKSSCV